MLSLSAAFRMSALGFSLLFLGMPFSRLAAQSAPPAPPLTTDPTQPNLFYGAIPPSGPNAPAIVFVHGLGGNFQDWIEGKNCPPSVTGCTGTNNDMYDLAYGAGFRTSFMSLNLDNSNNNSSIQTNAAMLQTMFPKILAQFGVTQVYFVCHSKGGLDFQDAIANPQWIGIAKAVILLGTPNQGDALADWIFSPAGEPLGVLLGLLTPGMASLEIANVLQLRTQWDPIFEDHHVLFYTLSGDTFACAPGVPECPTAITGPILLSITGGKSAPPNDGLVTEPETFLPTTYAMELGVIHADHYLLRMGGSSFSYINGHVMELENQQPGFATVETGGFGSVHNTYAWSMAWFNNKLYVGTGREVNCVTYALSAIQLGIPSLYPPIIGDCTPDYHLLPLQAEIWQYDPTTNIWTRVFQSPNSLTTVDNAGNTVATARDIGFRSLSLVTEPGGISALYAGGVTSEPMFESPTAFGTWPPPRILRTTDGVNWAPLPQDPGTFLGDLSLNGTPQFPNCSIRSGQQLNGSLFLQAGDFPGEGRVFSSIPGQNPATGDNAYQWASPPADQMAVWILQEYNNFIYAGTGLPPAAGPSTYGVYKTDGTGTAPFTWTPIITNGAYAEPGLVGSYAISMEPFATPDCPGIGCLYVGTDEAAEIVRIHPDDTWDLVVGSPRTIPQGQPGAGTVITPLSGIGEYFGNGFTGNITRMSVGSQGLYVSTWDWSADEYPVLTSPSALWNQEFGMDVWRTSDGTNWYMISKVGFGDGNNQEGRSWASTPYGLYLGTARFVGGAQVFLVDNGTVDFNRDGVIDEKDVSLMTARLNAPATGPKDPMDLNRDGKVTAADVKLLRTQCTYPGCAVPAARATTTLAAPLITSAPGTPGGPVSLTWSAISGAQDYVVYTIEVSTALNIPPPGMDFTGELAAACNGGGVAATLDLCYMERAVQGSTSTALYGFPGPPILLGRVTAPTYYQSTSPTLQALYFVRAEDSYGNLSPPSNVVGGPSLAAQ